MPHSLSSEETAKVFRAASNFVSTPAIYFTSAACFSQQTVLRICTYDTTTLCTYVESLSKPSSCPIGGSKPNLLSAYNQKGMSQTRALSQKTARRDPSSTTAMLYNEGVLSYVKSTNEENNKHRIFTLR